MRTALFKSLPGFAQLALLSYALVFVGEPNAVSSQLLVPDQAVPPGTSVIIPVAFESEGSSVSGIQFDVQYDSSGMNLAATLGDPARIAGKSIHLVDLAPNKKR